MQVRDPPADLAEGELFGDALHVGREVRRRGRLHHCATAEKVAHCRLLGNLDVVLHVLLLVFVAVLLLEVVQLTPPPPRRRRWERRCAIYGAVEILAGAAGVPSGEGRRDGGGGRLLVLLGVNSIEFQQIIQRDFQQSV